MKGAGVENGAGERAAANEPLRIAMIGAWPAIEALDAAQVKPRYRARKTAHPTSWLRALAHGLARRDDVAAITVLVDSREVRRTCVAREGKLALVFLPKIEPGQSDPFHGHWPARLRARPWLRRLRPHLVHGHGTEGANGWLAATSGRPNVVTLQGILAELDALLGWPRLRLWAATRIERLTVAKTNGLIVSSRWAERWALRRRTADAIRYIPNAVNPEFLDAHGDLAARRFVCIGTLTAFKDPLTVIRAFGAAALPDSELVMIGDGPLRAACERAAAAQGAAARIVFTGRIGRAAIVERLRHARGLVIGSRVDTSPNVVLEALAMGVPVVGTDAAGVPDMFRDGAEGFVVPAGDAARMADALRRLAADGDEARALGEAGRARVRREHSPERIADEHVLWYRRIVSRAMKARGGSRAPGAGG